MRLARAVWLVGACAFASIANAAPAQTSDVATWLAENGVSTQPSSAEFGAFTERLASMRVVGLGEATHGQHEAFELKRELTLRLIREHGFRLVAYESSGSRSRATEAYVQGATDDLDAAVGGLGMLIWAVEENARLLRELRAWNQAADADERVHFVGIDVQDPAAAAARLATLLPKEHELGVRATTIAADLEGAVSKLWSGDAAAYERVSAAARGLVSEVAALRELDPEAAARAKELRLGVEMYRSHGGRDRAQAELVLDALERAGPDARAVVWAHNAHVTRAPLRYLASDELAMGGHLGAALGERYFALGFLFGEGEFHANDRDDNGAWGFRRYSLTPPPPGSLEEPFVAAGRGDLLVDLRGAPRDGAIGEWLARGHGQRWFGGYNVAPDYVEAARDASRLHQTVPRADYDGLAFLARTTAATPRDPKRILAPK